MTKTELEKKVVELDAQVEILEKMVLSQSDKVQFIPQYVPQYIYPQYVGPSYPQHQPFWCGPNSINDLGSTTLIGESSGVGPI